ncbi:MAG: zinc/manganese transport system permease protein [Acidimicrobiaceae bacterium]|jgi:zinc/manganese transport system permease protein
MTNALIAGTAIALASGLVGYFLVLRRQLFTGDALSHVAFTGALGALAAGYDARVGLFVGTVAISLLLGAIGSRGRADDVVIGGVFAWVLGLGVLFLSLYTSSSASATSSGGVSALFGSILSLDATRTTSAVLVAGFVCAGLVVIGRPLLFASIDEAVAAARGVPVRALGFGFLLLVGLTAAEAAQAVGALLLLGLLAAPAGVAHRLTARPVVAFWLSGGVAVAVMWAGLWLAYTAPSLPPSVAIVGVASVLYLAVLLITAGRRMENA